MCDTNSAISIMQEAYCSCNSLLGGKLHNGYLYGSYARGDYDSDSDVDILFTADMTGEELAEYHRQISRIASRMSLQHDITVSLTVDPVEQFERYRSILPYYQNVLREGVQYAG